MTVSAEKLASALVSKLHLFIDQDRVNESGKLLREIDNKSKRNVTISEALLDQNVLHLIFKILDTESLQIGVKQRSLGILVNLSCGLDKGKTLLIQFGVINKILTNWFKTEQDLACRKWCIAILANVSTLSEAKKCLVEGGGVRFLVEVLADSNESEITRGITTIVLINLMNEIREASYEAFSRGICRGLLEILQIDQKDCQNNAPCAMDIVLSRIPEARIYYIEHEGYKILANFLITKKEKLSLETLIHVISCMVQMAIVDENDLVLKFLLEINFREILEAIVYEERSFLVEKLDSRGNINWLIESLKEKQLTDLSPSVIFNVSKNVDIDGEFDTETGVVEKLRDLSQDFTPTEQLENLIQWIFDTCRDDEAASQNFVRDGILIELLKLINSPSRTVRKCSAAIMATVTREIDVGIASFVDYDGVSIVMQTIRTEDDCVIRRLLVTSLSNSLTNQIAAQQFANDEGLNLFCHIMESDSDSVTRSKAARGLGTFINQSNEFASSAVDLGCCEILTEMLTHSNPKCQNAAARTLGLILFKNPSEAIDRVIDAEGVETILKVLESESSTVDVKFPTSWCLSQLVEQREKVKQTCKEREQLLAILEKLRDNESYDKQDRSLLMQKLTVLIELIK